MAAVKHGRRSRVKGQDRHRARRPPKPLKAKNVKGWKPSGFVPATDCRKVPYATGEEARKVASFMQRAYHCSYCASWHITSVLEQKTA